MNLNLFNKVCDLLFEQQNNKQIYTYYEPSIERRWRKRQARSDEGTTIGGIDLP